MDRFVGVPCKNIIQEAEKIPFYVKNTLPDLKEYISRKTEFLNGEDTPEKRQEVRSAYAEIHEDFKLAMHMGEITEEEFGTLIDILKEKKWMKIRSNPE